MCIFPDIIFIIITNIINYIITFQLMSAIPLTLQYYRYTTAILPLLSVTAYSYNSTTRNIYATSYYTTLTLLRATAYRATRLTLGRLQ